MTQLPIPRLSLHREWKKLKLWYHQIRALENVEDYLDQGPDGAALIRMPTGTGKTGIMGVVSQFLSRGSVLIVVPWAHLRNQICAEVGEEFWRKIGETSVNLKSVISFTPTRLPNLPEFRKTPSIVVCTYQTLQRIQQTDPTAYSDIKEHIDLVLADEGHREPAPSWSLATRGLAKPTVLFTATPYRNDFYAFKIADQFVFRLPHHVAEAERYIRTVAVHERDISTNAVEFVNELIRFYEEQFQSLKPSAVKSPRAIVRCENDSEIQEIAALIRQKGHSAIEIHDTFSDTEADGRYRTVPTPNIDATFWVHQNKLIEGVDDPSFCLLALYSGFRNTRALVQQIGRIVRNANRRANQTAHVLSRSVDRQAERWRSYLEYERLLGDRSVEPSAAEMSSRVLTVNSELMYLDRGFRKPFDPNSPDFYRFLAFTRSALVFRVRDAFSFPALVDALRVAAKEEETYIVAEALPGHETVVFAHYRIGLSPCLQERIAFDSRFGYTLAHMIGSLLFLTSSESLLPDYLEGTTTLIQPTELERLFSSERTRMSQVSLLNSDLGVYSVRRRSISAASLADLAPNLVDHAQFCSTAEGVVLRTDGQNHRNYVGFTRSRVAQRDGGRVDFQNYLRWATNVANILQDEVLQDDILFDRYAEPVRAPEALTPEHILIDIENFEEEYLIVNQDGTSMEAITWEDRCSDIISGQFAVTIGKQIFNASIRYNSATQRFTITSSDLQRVIQRQAAERRRNLVARLNFEQSFRVITTDGLIYAHQQFYKSRLPLWGKNSRRGIDLSHVLFARTELSNTTSEKGKEEGTANGTTWEKGSVFELIDRRGRSGLLESDGLKADILVCDDLGNELADFIALQRNPLRVVFIHAKQVGAGGQGTKSASAFHALCSQVMKNLAPITPQWEGSLKNVGIWNKKWRGTTGQVDKRIRRSPGNPKAAAIWAEIRDAIRNPSASREVWLVVGAGLSFAAFEAARSKARPPGYLIQLIYLLQGTWSAVSSVGGILKIFCGS